MAPQLEWTPLQHPSAPLPTPCSVTVSPTVEAAGRVLDVESEGGRVAVAILLQPHNDIGRQVQHCLHDLLQQRQLIRRKAVVEYDLHLHCDGAVCGAAAGGLGSVRGSGKGRRGEDCTVSV